ncbi:hypothetical protein HB837_15410 [Listeria innocua]|uniref:hypothetical protein n=1 Tax=Listeria innocua TaxID=1642 RepID=UPI0016279E5D|nr:hypothetical protein [Listeria innocua]MBC1353798.1 hypothetical protein [Listeria innocua]
MGIIFNFNWSKKRKESIKRCQKEQKQLKDMKDALIFTEYATEQELDTKILKEIEQIYHEMRLERES